MSVDPLDTLQTYISLYIREEVQYEGFTRNIGNFTRFLEVISFSHGSLLNISNVARECEVERKVVENYVSILEDILLASRLNIFSKRAQEGFNFSFKVLLIRYWSFQGIKTAGTFR